MQRSLPKVRRRRIALASILVGAGLATLGSSSASAATVSPVCDVRALDAAGNTPPPETAPLATGVDLPNLTVPDLGSGADVETGTVFEVSTASVASPPLPAQVEVDLDGDGPGAPLAVTVLEVKNIELVFETTGAAALGTPTTSGGNVLGASAAVAGNKLTLTLPGTTNGSTLPRGTAYFPGGGVFTPPSITLPVTASATPGTITTQLVGLKLLVKPNLLPLGVELTCTVPANTIGSVNVVAPPPPPPGAPDAVNDAKTTGKDTAVVIDVLANDTPEPNGLAIDADSLAISTPPTKGTAVVNADHTVTYTPSAGVTGVDSFKYELCSEADPQTETEGACDTATVTVSIEDAAAAATTTTTAAPVAAATTPTTAAAAAELPRTGGSALPLAGFGGSLLLGGIALVMRNRRQATRFVR